jgi:hypothetical protein
VIRDALPNRRQQISFRFQRGQIQFIGSIGFSPTFQAKEVFLSCDKTTTEIEALGRDASILISLALQHGCEFDTMRHAITREHNGSASTLVGQLLDEIEKIAPERPLEVRP